MNHPFTLMGDLNVITVLYFAFFVFTVVLGTYVYVRNEGSRISLVFLLLTVSIAVLDLNEALYSWTTVRSDAFAFQSFKSIGYVFWWPLILHLLLLIRFERIGRGYRIVLGVLYAYSLVLVVCTLAGISHPGDLTKRGIVWIDTPYWHPVALPYLVMMPLCVALDVIQMFLIRRNGIRSNRRRTVRQINLIMATSVPFFGVGLFFNVIAPNLGIIVPSIGHLFVGLWILVLGYSIVRYRFLVPTLEYASRQIFKLAGEMIVLTDLRYVITGANDSFVRKTGGSGIGSNLGDLVEGAGGADPFGDLESPEPDRIVKLKTGDGQALYVKVNGSVLSDKDDRIGYVFVLSDISDLKNQNELLEAKVGERTAELLLQKKEAERRLRVTEIYTRRSIVEIIGKGEDPTQFKPVAKKVSVLFSDIRNFTGISERFTPLETVALLNEYFDSMNECILGNRGEIDKLIGDCIMAIYLDPDDSVVSAIEMRKKLRAFNDNRQLPSRINNGIGINFGEVVSGNIGSTDKMDYTVIGDIVNTSSRIESLTKYYRLPILISDDVRNNLTGSYFLRFVDMVLVKGKGVPVGLYEVFDHESDEIKALKIDNQAVYRELFDLYRAGSFEEALGGYLDLRERLGSHTWNSNLCRDPVVDLYIERCHDLITRRGAGLLENWNGVFEFQEK